MSRAGTPRFRVVSVAVVRAGTTVAPGGERRPIRVVRRAFLILVPAGSDGSAG
ncbi:hypothetical protein [Amycolatopsis sp. cmx-4-68]|uniref:hypothetical protein n=1 Tax=Amycolatopsis sp. cmx-4-68 TaxID=2790938 RepID=UPI00397AE355